MKVYALAPSPPPKKKKKKIINYQGFSLNQTSVSGAFKKCSVQAIEIDHERVLLAEFSVSQIYFN